MELFDSADQTYDAFKVVVTTQISMNVSIILACVPFLKPLLDNIHSGWSTSDTRTGLGFNSIVDNFSTTNFALGSVVKSNNQSQSGRNLGRPH